MYPSSPHNMAMWSMNYVHFHWRSWPPNRPPSSGHNWEHPAASIVDVMSNVYYPCWVFSTNFLYWSLLICWMFWFIVHISIIKLNWIQFWIFFLFSHYQTKKYFLYPLMKLLIDLLGRNCSHTQLHSQTQFVFWLNFSALIHVIKNWFLLQFYELKRYIRNKYTKARKLQLFFREIDMQLSFLLIMMYGVCTLIVAVKKIKIPFLKCDYRLVDWKSQIIKSRKLVFRVVHEVAQWK